MKFVTSLIFLCCFAAVTWAQGANNLTVNVLNPIQVSYSSFEQLLEPKVINNAIELRTTSKPSSFSVFANFVYQAGSQTVFQNNPVTLKLSFASAGLQSINMNSIGLASSPTLLFVQPGTESPVVNTAMYNLVIPPFTKFVQPDNYHFTIIFTTTAQ